MTLAPRSSPSLRVRAALAVGDVASLASRLSGRGRGSTIGGAVALKLAPNALSELAEGRRTIVVSATNGKTTTTHFVAAGLTSEGKVAHNDEGANLPSGLVTALASSPGASLAALEVDERFVPGVLSSINVSVFVALNLTRDQLDRHHEVAGTAALWRQGIRSARGALTVVANVDDPLIVWAVRDAPRIVWVSAGSTWHDDTVVCPECRSIMQRSDSDWRCSSCDLARPKPAWHLEGLDAVGPAGRQPLQISVPGSFNRGNALMALAALDAVGIEAGRAAPRFRDVRSPGGRYFNAAVPLDGRTVDVRLLLAKNPAGWEAALDLVEAESVVVAIASQAADGRDPSWLWDVPFERLANREVVVTGGRAADVGVRLEYGGVATSSANTPMEALAATRGTSVDVLASYTQFQTFRTALEQVARG